MIIRSFNIFTNEGAIFLLDHGIVLSQTCDVIDHEACFGLYYANFKILYRLGDVGGKVRFELLCRLDFI